MTILSARDLRRSHGMRDVFRGVRFAMEARERVGFVGRNGAGKSTLARVLAGIEPPDAGEVILRKGARVGYLAQEPAFAGSAPAVEVVLGGLASWRRAHDEHAALSERLAAGVDDPRALAELVAAQAAAAARVEALGGWQLEHRRWPCSTSCGCRVRSRWTP